MVERDIARNTFGPWRGERYEFLGGIDFDAMETRGMRRSIVGVDGWTLKLFDIAQSGRT